MRNLNHHFLTLIIFSMTLILNSCSKDEDGSVGKIKNVIGFVQKGPFINGSSVTAFDLQQDLSPSGKSYNTNITDNKGTFELNNILLSSDYVKLRADGFYFNEISGNQSDAQITLYALSQIVDKNDININILTHLEKARVEYLIINGKSFTDSKIQAQKEILTIFNIDKGDIKTSENLNIAESGEDNGVLLAISSLLQGYRSESELTELLSNISNDIKEDGILKSDFLGSALINHAVTIDTARIRNNLTKRYNDIGATASIPDFEKYIANFISETEFMVTGSIIDYPQNGLYGPNILALNDTIYDQGHISVAANLPKGTTLKIVITAIDCACFWSMVSFSASNWAISNFNGPSQSFTAINSGINCDVDLLSFPSGRYLIEYYESSSETLTRIKIIKVI